MIRRILPLLALLAGSALHAEPMAPYPTIEFRGTITASANDTLTVRLPDGTTGPWTGPLPDYPYQAGDEFVLTFDINSFPPDSLIDPSGNPLTGVVRYPIVGLQQATSGSVGAVRSDFDITGPFESFGSQFTSGMVIAYDTETGSFSLEFDQGGDWNHGNLDGPTYIYDQGAGEFRLVDSTGLSNPFLFSGSTAADGSSTARIYGSLITGPDGNGVFGTFETLISGAWFLNGERYGGATQVPEPGPLGLLVVALGAIALRRRRLRAAA